MWPWGHLGCGYLAYRLWQHYTDSSSPNNSEIAALVLGTQLPDLIDKPLSWTLGVLPAGRTLAHSALSTSVVFVVVLRLTHRFGRPSIGHAFIIGYGTHLLGDTVALHPDHTAAPPRFLLWPLLPIEQSHASESIVKHFETIEQTPCVRSEVLLLVVAILVWARDGYPGIPIRREKKSTLNHH